jgi:kinesin family protein 5
MAENVQVVLRFRPLSEKESLPSALEITDTSVLVSDKNSTHEFTFDYVFGVDSTQESVYDKVARTAVESVCNGYNSTIFAYGCSGTGKTFTMFGDVDSEQCGIIPRACETIFRNTNKEVLNCSVKFSFIEIYNENIRDLLNRRNSDLAIRKCEKGIYIQGLTEKLVYGPEDILSSISEGSKQRTVTSTQVNSVSSRSHALLTVTLTQTGIDESEIVSKLNLVDLAGSENIGRSEVHGIALAEAQNINRSLSALGNVINALTEVGRDHIPYRDSKLTYILQDSLGGNSKTVIIATASPNIAVVSETLSTMKFAKRAKEIKNAPKVNKNESHTNLLKTISMLNKKINILEHKLADSEHLNRGVSEEMMKIMIERWENKINCLDKELEGERTRNKNLLELFEKQRELCINISRQLMKEKIKN